MTKKLITILITLVVVSILPDCLQAEKSGQVDYLTKIKPLFEKKCYACHGVLKQEAELRLETRELMLTGGDSGAVLVAKDPENSLLLQRILAEEDERMPPAHEGEALNEKEIALVRNWISQGAIAPDEPVPEPPSEHWAYKKPVRVEIPRVKNPDWNSNPIDALLAIKMEEKKLVPVSLADKRILLRRVYLDLVGFPPTKDQYDAFLNDHSDQAYEKVVDELLESPQYGERWGRHWMDIWRYTDWYGLNAQLRNSQKHIWHWRDWILESLNKDKGYDQMILEMLAADEIAPTDPDRLRATGYLARQYYLFNRTKWMDETIEHTAKSMLGITMNCTKCHDHKYDPISQVDYYRLRSFFEPYQVRLDALPGETNLEKDGLPRVFDAHPDVATYLHVRGNEKEPDKNQEITPGVPEILAFAPLSIQPVSLPVEAYQPALRSFVLEDQLADAEKNIETKQAELKKTQKTLESAAERESKLSQIQQIAQEENLFLRDEFDRPNPAVWETGPGDWIYSQGKLTQLRVVADRSRMHSQKNHPADFQARLKFVTRGGDKWKSVGFAFDVTNENEKQVYLSAVSPGSKLQVAYGKNGNYSYPASGRVDRKVDLNQEYDLVINVKGKVVNLFLNSDLVLAYELEREREPGLFHLNVFDAQADFESLEVYRIPESVELIPPSGSEKIVNPEVAKIDVRIAEEELKAAEFNPEVLEKAYQADLAKSRETDENKSKELIRAAVKAERKLKYIRAKVAVAKAERKLLTASAKDKSKAEAELKKAKEALPKAKEAIEQGGEKYTRVRASIKAMEGPDETKESRMQPYPKTSTGRRTALARWIIDTENPLTARVAVNHIWMRHFGQPLVEPVTDFGLRTKKPVQHELLDWLAVEFMENNWSMKHLHRLMVTSRAYRLRTSALKADEDTKSIDPGNQYYWKRSPIRMESQIIRDSMLQLAGVLDLTMGGPPLDTKDENGIMRRSLYFKHSRDDRSKFLSMFDDADILKCYRRDSSIIPQQALTLSNSRLSIAMARKITEKIENDSDSLSDEDFIRTAFELILASTPSQEEQEVCREALQSFESANSGKEGMEQKRRARENLVHALLNHNDFITIR